MGWTKVFDSADEVLSTDLGNGSSVQAGGEIELTCPGGVSCEWFNANHNSPIAYKDLGGLSLSGELIMVEAKLSGSIRGGNDSFHGVCAFYDRDRHAKHGWVGNNGGQPTFYGQGENGGTTFTWYSSPATAEDPTTNPHIYRIYLNDTSKDVVVRVPEQQLDYPVTLQRGAVCGIWHDSVSWDTTFIVAASDLCTPVGPGFSAFPDKVGVFAYTYGGFPSLVATFEYLRIYRWDPVEAEESGYLFAPDLDFRSLVEIPKWWVPYICKNYPYGDNTLDLVASGLKLDVANIYGGGSYYNWKGVIGAGWGYTGPFDVECSWTDYETDATSGITGVGLLARVPRQILSGVTIAPVQSGYVAVRAVQNYAGTPGDHRIVFGAVTGASGTFTVASTTSVADVSSGRVRLVRSDDTTFTAYYYSSGSWVSLGYLSFSSERYPDHTKFMEIALFAHNADNVLEAHRVTFQEFNQISGTPVPIAVSLSNYQETFDTDEDIVSDRWSTVHKDEAGSGSVSNAYIAVPTPTARDAHLVFPRNYILGGFNPLQTGLRSNRPIYPGDFTITLRATIWGATSNEFGIHLALFNDYIDDLLTKYMYIGSYWNGAQTVDQAGWNLGGGQVQTDFATGIVTSWHALHQIARVGNVYTFSRGGQGVAGYPVTFPALTPTDVIDSFTDTNGNFEGALSLCLLNLCHSFGFMGGVYSLEVVGDMDLPPTIPEVVVLPKRKTDPRELTFDSTAIDAPLRFADDGDVALTQDERDVQNCMRNAVMLYRRGIPLFGGIGSDVPLSPFDPQDQPLQEQVAFSAAEAIRRSEPRVRVNDDLLIAEDGHKTQLIVPYAWKRTLKDRWQTLLMVLPTQKYYDKGNL
jgi:hypothetical protein